MTSDVWKLCRVALVTHMRVDKGRAAVSCCRCGIYGPRHAAGILGATASRMLALGASDAV